MEKALKLAQSPVNCLWQDYNYVHIICLNGVYTYTYKSILQIMQACTVIGQ